MTVVPAVLLAGSLAVGVASGFGEVVAHAVNEAGSGGAVVPAPHWSPAGVLLDLASTLLALGLAALAVTRPTLLAAPDRAPAATPAVRARRGPRGLGAGGRGGRRAGPAGTAVVTRAAWLMSRTSPSPP